MAWKWWQIIAGLFLLGFVIYERGYYYAAFFVIVVAALKYLTEDRGGKK